METPQPSGARLPRRRWLVGMTVAGAGVLLVALALAYYLYGWTANRTLGGLAYTPGNQIPPTSQASALTLEGLRGTSSSQPLPLAPGSGPLNHPDPAGVRLYPGERIIFNFWAEPWTARDLPSLGAELLEDFLPVDQVVLGSRGTLPPATHIRIPAIEVDAKVEGLRILDLGDSRAYETPNNVVGHIPESASPGELGNVWLFGHLQSPIRGEGSVFRDLPVIPDLLRTGQKVYVVLDTPAMSYLYEAYTSEVVYQDDLRISQGDQATLTLVTCVPTFTYDHRLLVTARLVGAKPTG